MIMGLFKSKEEKRIERDVQIRQTLGLFVRQVKSLAGKEQAYLVTAQEALQINARQQYELARKALKQTLAQRRRLEQQLLTLRIATQMRDQAESQVEFAGALNAVSKTIADAFGTADLLKTQKNFEEAMSKAKTMERRADIFLDASSDSMFVDTDDLEASDDEIDNLIEGKVVHEEEGVDDEIARGLSEVADELSRDKK
jgi:hypothetical protein